MCMFALTIPYTSKNSLLMFGDDAQSGMKRNARRVTIVRVEQYYSFPSCGSGRCFHRSRSFEAVVAQRQPANSIESACWAERGCSNKKSSIKVGLPARDSSGLVCE